VTTDPRHASAHVRVRVLTERPTGPIADCYPWIKWAEEAGIDLIFGEAARDECRSGLNGSSLAPLSQRLHARLYPDLLERIDVHARYEGQSRSSMIVKLIEEALEARS
jgi:hypothetical protein